MDIASVNAYVRAVVGGAAVGVCAGPHAGASITIAVTITRIRLVFIATLLILGVVLYAFAPHPPATPKQVKDAIDLESYFNRLVDLGNPPGVSVVVKDGRIVFNHAFGYADGPRREKATPETVHHW